MELSNTFKFRSWEIQYTLQKPENPATDRSDMPTAVFVHGTPWSSAVFVPIAKALLAKCRYQVLLYDLVGYGQSQQIPSTQNDILVDTSVKTQAELLAALLEHLKLNGSGGPDVIAHDIAGLIALRAHLIHACKFNSLFLLDTNAVLPWGDGFYNLVRSDPATFYKLPPGIFEAVVRAVIRSACFKPQNLNSGWEDILAQPWVSHDHDQEERQRSFIRQIAQANDEDAAEMLDQDMYERVQCPVKIVWGANDEWIPRIKMERLAELLKHCLKDFVVIPEAGHLVMVDQPTRFTSELLGWLETQQ